MVFVIIGVSFSVETILSLSSIDTACHDLTQSCSNLIMSRPVVDRCGVALLCFLFHLFPIPEFKCSVDGLPVRRQSSGT